MPRMSQTRISEIDVTFAALDGVMLHGTLFSGDGAGPAVLLSSAAALERRFYRAFAQHLVAQGASRVFTYDYRGIGASGVEASAAARPFRMKDWGVLDFPGAHARLAAAADGAPIVGIGHSYGGLAIGLSGISDRFERYAMVASLNGYFRRTMEPMRIFARMNLIGLPISLVLGRIPSATGLGTGLPGSVFRDFARWCRRPDFFFGDPTVPESARFADVKGRLLSVGLADDRWGTPAAVGALLRHLPNADLRSMWLHPTSSAIGHMGFFRRGQSSHWPEITRYLLAGDWPSAARPHAAETVAA